MEKRPMLSCAPCLSAVHAVIREFSRLAGHMYLNLGVTTRCERRGSYTSLACDPIDAL